MKLPCRSVLASLTVFTPSRTNDTSAPGKRVSLLSRTVPVIVASDLLGACGKCVAGDERHQRDQRQTKTKCSSHAKDLRDQSPFGSHGKAKLVQARRLTGTPKQACYCLPRRKCCQVNGGLLCASLPPLLGRARIHHPLSTTVSISPIWVSNRMIDEVQSTKLPNGIAVLTEHMPGLRSVTAGIWVRRGSRHETAELNGICHFIEHAVFKGTRHRSARDIAVETDRLGGNLDAYTTHEMTGFTTKVADTALSQAIDLLADLVSHPRFEQEDLEREQKVILEEMKMVEDTPDELLGELFNAAYFPNQPLGRPIEGTRETVSTFDHKTTVAFHAREFSYSNLVVAAAGNVDHARLVELVGSRV